MRFDNIHNFCSRFGVDLARVRLWRGRKCTVRGRREDDLDRVLGVNRQFDRGGEGILGVEEDFREDCCDAVEFDCAFVFVVHGGQGRCRQNVTGRSWIEERLLQGGE